MPPYFAEVQLVPLLASGGSDSPWKAPFSIHTFTCQSRANAPLIQSIHAKTFTPSTRNVATKVGAQVWGSPHSEPTTTDTLDPLNLLPFAHQNRTIAIASDFRVDGPKSPEILQKGGVSGSEIAARNRRSLATFHRTLKSQCSTASSCLGNR